MAVMADQHSHININGTFVKVRFSPVQSVYYLNLELDCGFGSTPLPELWTGPSVLVQRGFGSGPAEGDEPRTEPPKSGIGGHGNWTHKC